MSRIAILGWGSLVWDPQDLRYVGDWNADGPVIQVEFARQSNDGRITLVLTETVKVVQSLWCVSEFEDISYAIENLRAREGIPKANSYKHIGRWSPGSLSPNLIANIDQWAASNELDYVIWTNLPPKFNKIETKPDLEVIISYLKILDSEVKQRAIKYIVNTPLQIDTEYRPRIMEVID